MSYHQNKYRLANSRWSKDYFSKRDCYQEEYKLWQNRALVRGVCKIKHDAWQAQNPHQQDTSSGIQTVRPWLWGVLLVAAYLVYKAGEQSGGKR